MDVTTSIILQLQQQRMTMRLQECLARSFGTMVSGLWSERNHWIFKAEHKATLPLILCKEITLTQVGTEDTTFLNPQDII